MDQNVTSTHAMSAFSVTLIGLLYGLNYEMLLAGFAGGMVSLTFLGQMSIWRRFWTLIVSTVSAAYMGPVAGAWLAKSLPPDMLHAAQPFTGFIIGVTAQVLIPSIMKLVSRKVETA